MKNKDEVDHHRLNQNAAASRPASSSPELDDEEDDDELSSSLEDSLELEDDDLSFFS